MPVRMRVMTWNILHQAACEEERDHPWRERRAGARRIVEHARPDVLCLQEAYPEQADDLLEGLPDHWWVGRDRHGGNEGEGCPIAFDTRRWGLVRWEQFWLSPTPETPASLTWFNDVPRIVVVALLEHRATGQRVHVANTHLDHLVPSSRTHAVDLLHRRLPEGTTEVPLVLAGDFNSPSWMKPHRLLVRGPRRFHDTFRAPGRRVRRWAGTFHKFKGHGFARVDWVLTQPKLPSERLMLLRDKPDERWPSDHFPVVVDLLLPGIATPPPLSA